MSNKNEIKNPKFAVAIDHNAGYDKSFTHIALRNRTLASAALEAGCRAMQEKEVYCLHILKKDKGEWKSLMRCYKGGLVEFTNDPWFYFTFDK